MLVTVWIIVSKCAPSTTSSGTAETVTFWDMPQLFGVKKSAVVFVFTWLPGCAMSILTSAVGLLRSRTAYLLLGLAVPSSLTVTLSGVMSRPAVSLSAMLMVALAMTSPLKSPSPLTELCLIEATCGSVSARSSFTARTSTVWGTFQLAGVKSR